ncbi:hypothetical protein MKW94_012868 [Papaver nudicaule]|uniref:3-ketoacyl-CoA synthase n=1 Tax=Papaver nudicaule TaxID=74823 RepID=A0AA41VGZ6_PAPNU|nr:hypothetical protein [Papaver nudicaule]
MIYMRKLPQTMYLVDFVCYHPPTHLQVPTEYFLKGFHHYITLSASSVEFPRKILERSGLGEETCLSEGLHAIPPNQSLALARKETEEVMFINPKDIGILVVNCSLFSITPSLCDIIINKYKLRNNVKSFTLGGMGCSARVIAVDLAKGALQVHRNTCAIVLSTENLTLRAYHGNNKSMMITSCLFRIGGAAILLSNKNKDKRQAKYKLVQMVRTHHGSDDEAYKSVSHHEDEAGELGVSLSKSIMRAAGETLKTNITTLGPLVLPFGEQLRFLYSMVNKKLFKNPKTRMYIPDFKLAFEHFCIHAGGRGIIDEVEKNLKLYPVHVEASRMTLHRFGNTSSSTIWYELAYIEAKGRMRKNDRCNSAVWIVLKNVKPYFANGGKCNPWEDCIHRYHV